MSNPVYYGRVIQDFYASHVGRLFERYAELYNPTLPLHVTVLTGDIESLNSLLEPVTQNDIDLLDAY